MGTGPFVSGSGVRVLQPGEEGAKDGGDPDDHAADFRPAPPARRVRLRALADTACGFPAGLGVVDGHLVALAGNEVLGRVGGHLPRRHRGVTGHGLAQLCHEECE